MLCIVAAAVPLVSFSSAEMSVPEPPASVAPETAMFVPLLAIVIALPPVPGVS